MKITGLIIAVYLILLAIMPCNDSGECESQVKTEQSNHNGHEDREENCTPFCLCASCPTHVYVSDTLDDNFPPSIFTSSCEMNSFVQSHISHAIWQPPRTV